ncbi:MAG: hypothetical protein V1799_16420 [bacterium]
MKTKVSIIILLIPVMIVSQSKSWEAMGPEGGRIAAFAQDPQNGAILYTTTYGYPSKIFKSSTHGQQWNVVGSINDYISGFAIDPRISAIIYVFSSSRLYRSTNGGQIWSSIPLPANYYLYDICLDPIKSNTIHASGYHYVSGTTYQSYVAYLNSTNAGASWTTNDILLTLSYNEGYGRAIAVDSSDNQTILIGGYVYVLSGSLYNGYGKLLRSTNSGVSFSDVTPSGSGYFYDVAIDPKNSGKAYAASSGGVYRTTDKGLTWLRNNGFVGICYYLSLDKANPNNLLAQSYGQLYRSTDAGINWLQSLTTGSGYSGIIMENSPSQYMFYANDAGIFQSSNRGNTWEPCNRGITSANITSLYTPSSSMPILYAGFQYNTVFKTTAATNPSVSWQMLDRFYTCTNINAILSLPEDPNKLYALEGGG